MSNVVLSLSVHLLGWVSRRAVPRDERGQATAEYALVLLGAAALALLVVAWATKTNLVGKLLEVVFGHLTAKVK